jgi:hypothetical protein
MPYHIDDAEVTLPALMARIRDTDLIPSRVPLLLDINAIFEKLEAAGLRTLSDFRKAAKNPKSVGALSEKAGVDADYLLLLRREAEGYFPKAAPLGDFAWLERDKIAALEGRGYKDAALLYEAIESKGLERVFGAGGAFAEELAALVGLTRIQWVSPLTAKMLFEAGYQNPAAVAAADAAMLTDQLARANSGGKYFKGKIGQRDAGRLIKAASYVSNK